MNKQIKDFTNYTISDTGVVTSVIRKHPRWGTLIEDKPKEMKLTVSGKYRNYLQVRLTALDGTSKQMKVHRLVAEAFIPNPENKPQVNHIDGNTLNNNVSNLEWCNNSENQLHAYATGLKSGLNGKSNPAFGKAGFYAGKRGDSHNKSKRVVQLTLEGIIIAGFESCTLAADHVKGQAGNISKACRGKIKQSSGYKWVFATEEHKYLFIDSIYKEEGNG